MRDTEHDGITGEGYGGLATEGRLEFERANSSLTSDGPQELQIWIHL
jgi:hypothetical protein